MGETSQNGQVYRVPELEIFKEEHDRDDRCLYLRKLFSLHMKNLTGHPEPEPDTALQAHNLWKERVCAELHDRYNLSMYQQIYDIATHFGLAGMRDEELDSDDQLLKHKLFAPGVDTFVSRAKSVDTLGLLDPFIEPNNKLAGFVQSVLIGSEWKAKRVYVGVERLIGIPLEDEKTNRWMMQDLIESELAHEMFHMFAKSEPATRGDAKNVWRSGLRVVYLDGDDDEKSLVGEGTWVDEALIEWTRVQIYPSTWVRYPELTFVFGLLDRMNPGLARQAFQKGYVEARPVVDWDYDQIIEFFVTEAIQENALPNELSFGTDFVDFLHACGEFKPQEIDHDRFSKFVQICARDEKLLQAMREVDTVFKGKVSKLYPELADILENKATVNVPVVRTAGYPASPASRNQGNLRFGQKLLLGAIGTAAIFSVGQRLGSEGSFEQLRAHVCPAIEEANKVEDRNFESLKAWYEHGGKVNMPNGMIVTVHEPPTHSMAKELPVICR